MRWLAVALGAAAAGLAGTSSASADGGTSVVYDSFQRSGGSYGLADYLQKWSNPYGLGEMDGADTRSFAGGAFTLSAVPFRTGVDLSVFDHLKYIATSNEAFAVPAHGSVAFTATIAAQTPGTVPGLVIHGVYGPAFAWTSPFLLPPPGLAPYEAPVLQGQQAGVVMNMIDFCTGQLFDWFVAGDTAFTLIERLPTSVTGNTSNPNCPGATYVGAETMYTQIVREVPAQANVPHEVSIRYTQKLHASSVDYYLDGKRVSHVDRVGIPLDKQGVEYTGTYPSLGPGESLSGKIGSFVIGHGLFSLIDAFPFQHPDAPDLSVSIPAGDGTAASAGKGRLFGQGAIGTFDDFTVTTHELGAGDD